MRLKAENIAFVKRLEMDGTTYAWYVAMKSGRICDSREYVNYEDGITVCKGYPFDKLPAAIKRFINTHKEYFFAGEPLGYREYVIR